MLKTLKRALIKVVCNITKRINLMSTRSSYYDEKCHQLCEIETLNYYSLNATDLKADPNEPVVKIDIKNISKYGARIQLEYYDSHASRPNLRFEQTSIPTILLLPNSESSIEEFEFLISNLVREKFRVLAFRFPGEYSLGFTFRY